MLDALVAEARVRWGLDPAAGLQVIATERLIATSLDPARPVLLVPLAVLGARSADPAAPGDGAGPVAQTVAPLPGRHGPRGREPLTLLRRLYPADHAVGRLGLTDGTTIEALGTADLAGALYLGPVAPELVLASPWSLPWLSNRLRQPDGCPWDREQTHASLRGHLLEEAYEVYDALESGASRELAGELGDLLLQVILHAQLAAEEGVFDLVDVQEAIGSKIVRRHPHVFGDAEARTASDVNRQWERIKAAERAEAAEAEEDGGGADRPHKSALDGISTALPGLAASQEMQERAANLGYDWPTVDDVVEKVHEELAELLAAESTADRAEELGDVLMVLVNVGRRHGIQAEAALRAANDKFRRRFREVERLAAQRGVALRDLDFAGLDELWDAAKDIERAGRTESAGAKAAAVAASAQSAPVSGGPTEETR
jgi:tetrapyrrole methylase family protein / MazG family protein